MIIQLKLEIAYGNQTRPIQKAHNKNLFRIEILYDFDLTTT
ncbi:hypothetical protein SAMN05661096_01488 [Marivirga sericea]|uniref:Uncharacterized protein n=1 Tax=Marivirga sericea TaxID=1028 RepID=A0A1X7JB46_9BACT|nr:hypothetical protein SAMN05661096_01488 [Marivirga sericea]